MQGGTLAPMQYQVNYETSAGMQSLLISPGSITLVTGPNGVGKSALLVTLYRALPQGVGTYLPGHRQINFNNGWETIGQDATQLITNLFQHFDSFNRYKGHWAEDQFKSTIKRLLHTESSYNRNFRGTISDIIATDNAKAVELSKARTSPIDTLNLIFEEARLPVSFTLTADGLSANREGISYQIDAMSDGERAALFIVSTMVTQSDNSVVLIDEPEKHLHPSITALLIEACVRAMPNVAMIVSSHDAFLIERLTTSNVIHIRNSSVKTLRPEIRIFDASIFNGLDVIPEDIRTALLGSRSKILFVEGELSSGDLALYSHIYDGVKVLPRGGHGKVSEAVQALSGLQNNHWLRAFGIIDGDGRSGEEKVNLAKKGIYALPSPSIENVFFFDEMISCFVNANIAYSGGASLEERVAAMGQRVIATAQQSREDIIALRASWVLERTLSEQKRSPSQIKNQQHNSISINVGDIIEHIRAEVDGIIATGDWKAIMHTLPIKRTGLPAAAAQELGAPNFREYCKSIIRQFDIKSKAAEDTITSLRARLPQLPS